MTIGFSNNIQHHGVSKKEECLRMFGKIQGRWMLLDDTRFWAAIERKVLRLRKISISVSGTTEKSALM